MKSKAFIYLRTKVDKVDFIVLRLILPPGRSEGFFLEAPVRSKDVIEKEETVASSPQLKDLQHNLRLVAACLQYFSRSYLGISIESKPNESLIKGWSVPTGDVDRLIQ